MKMEIHRNFKNAYQPIFPFCAAIINYYVTNNVQCEYKVGVCCMYCNALHYVFYNTNE